MPYGWQKPVDLAAHLLVRFFFPSIPLTKEGQGDGARGGHACVPLPTESYFFGGCLRKQNYERDDRELFRTCSVF